MVTQRFIRTSALDLTVLLLRPDGRNMIRHTAPGCYQAGENCENYFHILSKLFIKKCPCKILIYVALYVDLGIPVLPDCYQLPFNYEKINSKVKKVKVFPVHAMKAYGRSTGIAPPILNIGTNWRSAVNFTPRPLSLRGRTQVSIE